MPPLSVRAVNEHRQLRDPARDVVAARICQGDKVRPLRGGHQSASFQDLHNPVDIEIDIIPPVPFGMVIEHARNNMGEITAAFAFLPFHLIERHQKGRLHFSRWS